MALHIRDFRQSEAAGLSRLSESARRIGALPPHDEEHRILVGLRGDRLAGAACLELTSIPKDKDLLAGLRDMHFKAGDSTGVMRRMVPVRSAA